MRWTVPRMWEGQTVVIVGGGPSVNDHDLSRLHGYRTIVVNNAYRLLPHAEILFFRDCEWWKADKDGHCRWVDGDRGRFDGLVVSTCQQMADHPRVKYLRHGPERDGLTTEPGRLVRGNHAGHEALNLATHLGASRLFLLGYDMTRAHGDNWHADHKRTVAETAYQRKFKPGIEGAARALERLGVAVTNVSRISTLTCFPRVDTLEEALP